VSTPSKRGGFPLRLSTILKFGASSGIIIWLIVSRQDEFTAFAKQEKNLWWIVAAMVSITLAFAISYVRWHRLANAIDLDLKLSQALRLGFIGAFFNVIAFGVVGGDSLRAFYAARERKDRIPEAILSVFIDRAIGLMVMFGFAGLAWQLNRFMSSGGAETSEQLAIASICNTAGLLSICGVVILSLFLLFPGISKWSLFGYFERIPKVGGLIRQGIEAATLYSQRKSAIAFSICCSVATNLLFALTIWMVAQGVCDDAPAAVSHGVIAPISMVANSIPLPGGVGGMEVALASMYESYDAKSGLIVALCYRLCILVVSLIGWIVWLIHGRDVEQHGVEETAETAE